jgi:hypothetical protein
MNRNSHPLLDAILLNNDGAELLRQGRVNDATLVLCRAVMDTKNMPSFEEFGAPTTTATPPLGKLNALRSTVDSVAASSTGNVSHDEPRSSWQNEEAIYVYDRPLYVPLDIKIETAEDYDHVVLVLSIYVIFNIALARHQLGMMTGSSAALEQAMEMYQAILASPHFDNGDMSSSVVNDNVTSDLMKLLALNNLAHLHHERCEHDQSMACMNGMIELNSATGCLEGYDDQTSTLDIDVVLAIKLNLMYRLFPVVAQAA